MSFREPLFLLALEIVPVVASLAYTARRRGQRYAARFPGVPTVAAVLPQSSRLRRLGPAALFLAALAALAVALARPQATVAVPVERASAVLVMDSSRSMLADDVDPSRLDAAKAAGGSFLDEVPDSLRVGLVGFSTSPHTLRPPTTDRDDVRETIDGLVPDGGTATGDALRASLEMLEGRDGKRRPPSAVVLLSDGRASTGSEPLDAAARAAKLKIPVHTVALGTDDATVPSPDGRAVLPATPDPEALRDIARQSGGRFFEAADSGDLTDVYEELGSQIGTKDEKREITAGFAAGGAVLLLIATGLSLRWTGRIP
jgi:Ca-activated chloride channel family protein